MAKVQLSKINGLKLGMMIFLSIYGCLGSLNPSYDGPFGFLHGVDLIFHEAGHVLFIFFGEFLHFLGGSLTQILIPAGITGYFVRTQQYFASAIALFWTGQNFMDVSVYVKDASTQSLPLIGGEHDWAYLLGTTNLLAFDQAIGGFVYLIGLLLLLLSLLIGFSHALGLGQSRGEQQWR